MNIAIKALIAKNAVIVTVAKNVIIVACVRIALSVMIALPVLSAQRVKISQTVLIVIVWLNHAIVSTVNQAAISETVKIAAFVTIVKT